MPCLWADRRDHSFPVRSAALLLVTECPGRRVLACSEVRHLHGCTAAEARLAKLLAEGHGLREAAQSLGITYGTARAYLKIVFQKWQCTAKLKWWPSFLLTSAWHVQRDLHD